MNRLSGTLSKCCAILAVGSQQRASFLHFHNRSILNVALAFFTLGALGTWSDSHAAPAFARQTGMACAACHTTFPALNSFGRAFKSGGYTMIGAEAQVQGDDLSLPVVLNSSLVTKIRYQKTNGSDPASATNNGEFQFPDEGALLIGGRAGEHVGFMLEFATFGTADVGTGDVTGTADATGNVSGSADTGTGNFSLFASYKMPITYKVRDTNLLFIPFSTDSLGTAYGFELLNTGAQRSQRVGEDRSNIMAQQWLGAGNNALGSGAAGGFAFVASNSLGFVNYSLWQPTHGNWQGTGFAPYLRVVATPRLGSWDTGLGIQYFSGKATQPDGLGAEIGTKTEAQAIDLQALGMLGAMPAQLYAAYAKAPKSAAGADPNLFNPTAFDKTAYSVHGTVGVLPALHLLAGYRHGDTGAPTRNIDNVLTVGAMYHLAQNIKLEINHAMRSGSYHDDPATPGGASRADTAGSARTTLMIFGAF